MLRLHFLLFFAAASTAAAQSPIPWPAHSAAPHPAVFTPSLIEPIAPAAAEPTWSDPFANSEAVAATSIVGTEAPEVGWLASWQSGYLWLIGDDGHALAGFYDPFTSQYASGAIPA